MLPFDGCGSALQYPAYVAQSLNTPDHAGPASQVTDVSPPVEYPFEHDAVHDDPIESGHDPIAPLAGAAGVVQYAGSIAHVSVVPLHVPLTVLLALHVRVAVPEGLYPALQLAGPHDVPIWPVHPVPATPLAGADSTGQYPLVLTHVPNEPDQVGPD